MRPEIGKFYKWYSHGENIGQYVDNKYNDSFLMYKNSAYYSHDNNVAPFTFGCLDHKLIELSGEELKRIKLELL